MPGATSPAVTQANLKSTICRKGGYTGGVRPLVLTGEVERVDQELKVKQRHLVPPRERRADGP
ncbi:hypothetical protein [Streptomyces sp. NPDC093984]|uniref:hypothetical protein n=1 Tax=Streptomyces sp. NPDC093984 TaxID=3366052 RepID=UPI0038173648